MTNRRNFLKTLSTAGASIGLVGLPHRSDEQSPQNPYATDVNSEVAGNNLLEPILRQAVKSNGNEYCSVWSPKADLQPVCRISARNDSSVFFNIESNNNSGCHGGWEIIYTDIIPGKSYCFQAKANLSGIPHPVENISPEVYFFSGSDTRPLDWRYIDAISQDNREVVFRHILDTPQKADRMVIRLLLRWTAYGSVQFRDVSLTESQATAANTNISTIAVGSGWRSRSSIQENMNKCLEVIEKAAQKGADFILLPEVILTVGVSKDFHNLARPIPGKETGQIAECARSNNIAVALTMWEANGSLTHNAGLIISKNGDIAMKYRKIHLSFWERWSGVTPGDQYPCADLPGGRFGMQICYDNVLQEGARILARKGAEIILLPIMGDPRAFVRTNQGEWRWDHGIWDKIMSIRALDNHVWYVIARNSGPGSCIINPAGEIMASKNDGEDILMAKVDTSFRNTNSYIGSSYNNRYWRERRPSTYPVLKNTNFRIER